jgi:hypothetical protein
MQTTSALQSFLGQTGIYPFPSEFSNTVDLNPWTSAIEDFLERALDRAPMEGRPGGQGWAHQRWNEFYPQAYVKTAQAGSRINGGFRNALQMTCEPRLNSDANRSSLSGPYMFLVLLCEACPANVPRFFSNHFILEIRVAVDWAVGSPQPASNSSIH